MGLTGSQFPSHYVIQFHVPGPRISEQLTAGLLYCDERERLMVGLSDKAAYDL